MSSQPLPPLRRLTKDHLPLVVNLVEMGSVNDRREKTELVEREGKRVLKGRNLVLLSLWHKGLVKLSYNLLVGRLLSSRFC